jgi:uncharacterized protein with von Willebrand factor type A (vWA) domain
LSNLELQGQEQPSPPPLSMFNHVVRFSRFLHDAGIDVNSANLMDLCRSFSYIDIVDKDDFYETAKCTLISNRDSLDIFDAAFRQYWDQFQLPFSEEIVPSDEDEDEQNERADDTQNQQQNGSSEQQNEESDEGSNAESDPEQAGYSEKELLVKKDFTHMSEAELEKAKKIVSELIEVLINRKSKRYTSTKKAGNFDFRRMYRHSMPYGEYCMKLYYKNHPIKKTRLLLFCDVSGSMERYSSFLIQLIVAMADKLTDLEVALFSTRMTNFTPYLQSKNLGKLISEMSDQVHDWAGGTNIGGSLYELNKHYAHNMLHSSTVAIILSDGWDRGDATQMRSEIEVLKRSVHKLMWLNPLIGRENYEPICRGIQTALPFLDYFLPVHNLESLAEVIKTLRKIRM